jgi:ribosomal protein S18 acetylase RimI-like enzyme
VRALTPSDVPSATETLALAFDDDPMFRFLFPSGEARMAWLRVLMAGMLAQSMPDGAVTCTSSGDLVTGVCAVIPPGKFPPSGGRLVRFLFRRARPRMPRPTLHALRAGAGLVRMMDRLHHRGPHYYVQVLAVHPSQQGKGVGKRLLGAVLERARASAVPAYLETTKPSNVGFYRHMGFDVTAEETLRGGSPPLWAMTTRT